MAASLIAIEHQARALTAEERAKLAENLLESLRPPLAEIEPAWPREIEKRIAAFDRRRYGSRLEQLSDSSDNLTHFHADPYDVRSRKYGSLRWVHDIDIFERIIVPDDSAPVSGVVDLGCGPANLKTSGSSLVPCINKIWNPGVFPAGFLHNSRVAPAGSPAEAPTDPDVRD